MPYTPGSPVDAGARVIAQDLQKRLGQSVILEARSGAGSATGTKAAAVAAPDGYTLLLTGTPLCFLPTMYPNAGGEVVKDLVPIASFLICRMSSSWCRKSRPGRCRAGRLRQSQSGQARLGLWLGSTPHILGESLKQATGIDITSIPYRAAAIRRGPTCSRRRVHMNIAPLAAMLPLIQEGKVRPLAFTGPTRAASICRTFRPRRKRAFPTVGYDPDVWLGILGPPGTPAVVVDKINAAVNEGLKTPRCRRRSGDWASRRNPARLGSFAALLAEELAKWPALLAAAGIKAQ